MRVGWLVLVLQARGRGGKDFGRFLTPTPRTFEVPGVSSPVLRAAANSPRSSLFSFRLFPQKLLEPLPITYRLEVGVLMHPSNVEWT